MGIIGAMAALLLSGACGGSDRDKPEDTKTTTPAAVSLADTCPKIQDALDVAFAGKGGSAADEDYQRFADDVAALLAVVDPKGEPLLTQLVDSTKYLVSIGKAGGGAADKLDARGDWFDAMDRVTDTCQQLGAPLS